MANVIVAVSDAAAYPPPAALSAVTTQVPVPESAVNVVLESEQPLPEVNVYVTLPDPEPELLKLSDNVVLYVKVESSIAIVCELRAVIV